MGEEQKQSQILVKKNVILLEDEEDSNRMYLFIIEFSYNPYTKTVSMSVRPPAQDEVIVAKEEVEKEVVPVPIKYDELVAKKIEVDVLLYKAFNGLSADDFAVNAALEAVLKTVRVNSLESAEEAASLTAGIAQMIFDDAINVAEDVAQFEKKSRERAKMLAKVWVNPSFEKKQQNQS